MQLITMLRRREESQAAATQPLNHGYTSLTNHSLDERNDVYYENGLIQTAERLYYRCEEGNETEIVSSDLNYTPQTQDELLITNPS